jgi:hypothetical protein
MNNSRIFNKTSHEHENVTLYTLAIKILYHVNLDFTIAIHIKQANKQSKTKQKKNPHEREKISDENRRMQYRSTIHPVKYTEMQCTGLWSEYITFMYKININL